MQYGGMIKLVCIKEEYNFKLNEVYDGKYFHLSTSDGFSLENWAVEEPTGYQGYRKYLYMPLENFMRLSEWREQQINTILK